MSASDRKPMANELTGDRSLRFGGCLKEERLKKSPAGPGWSFREDSTRQ